jgi:hypothetical protein
MSSKTLFQYITDEKKKEAPLFQELRQKYPDFGENLLLQTEDQSQDDWLNGFRIANTWSELVKFYTGHSSPMIMKKFLSKILADKELAELEYECSIDEILLNIASPPFDNRQLMEKIIKKKTKKMIDRYLLVKLDIAKRVGLNLGQMINVIEQHTSPKNFEMPRNPRNLGLFYLIGPKKTYRALLTCNGEQASYLYDCTFIYSQLEGYSLPMGYDLSRVKKISVANIETLHDGLVKEQTYLEKKLDSVEIPYRGFRTWLPKIKIEGFDTYLPKTTGDLAEIGAQLKNCISTYKTRVLSGTDTIVAFKGQTTGKFQMALNVFIQEPDDERPGKVQVLEFRLKHNKRVSDKMYVAVESQISELFTQYKQELLTKMRDKPRRLGREGCQRLKNQK